ncbi:MAG: hypothetical protein K2R98_26310 [Gemmataceae bacterium]|nr:hypothetical protein [Gemmataceae bacterium]
MVKQKAGTEYKRKPSFAHSYLAVAHVTSEQLVLQQLFARRDTLDSRYGRQGLRLTTDHSAEAGCEGQEAVPEERVRPDHRPKTQHGS